MKRIQTLFTAFALSAPLVVGTGLASAQAYPQVYVQPAQHAQPVYPQPAQPAYGQPAYGQPAYGQPAYGQPAQPGYRAMRRMQRVDKTGTVQSFLVSGRRIRGVTLTDGTTVLVRAGSHAQLRRLRPGMLVRVRGFAAPGNATVIRDASVIALRSRQPRFPAPPPVVTPAPLPPPVVTPAPAPAPALQAIRSTIRSVQWGPTGLPQALILANGRQVYLPSAIAVPLAQRGIRIGEHVGIGMHTSANGTLVADTVNFVNGATFSANR